MICCYNCLDRLRNRYNILQHFLNFPILIRIRNLRVNEHIRDYFFDINLHSQKAEQLGQSYRLNTCDHSVSLMISKTEASICDYELLAKQSRYDLCPLPAVPQRCLHAFYHSRVSLCFEKAIICHLVVALHRCHVMHHIILWNPLKLRHI